MSLFDIDYNRFIKQLLPSGMRRIVTYRWLLALIAPVVYVYNLFMTNRASNLYLIQHTGQVVYMQAALNDALDSDHRRIRVADDVRYYPLYLYTNAELQPNYLFKNSEVVRHDSVGLLMLPYQQLYWPLNVQTPGYLFTGLEVLAGNYDFIIKMPGDLPFDLAFVRAMVNRYRLPSKNNFNVTTQ